MQDVGEQTIRNRSDALEYIQAMLGQLRSMADGERYHMLAYLIELAYIEATDIARGQRPSQIVPPAKLRENKRDSAA
jgi:hypothetical protein